MESENLFVDQARSALLEDEISLNARFTSFSESQATLAPGLENEYFVSSPELIIKYGITSTVELQLSTPMVFSKVHFPGAASFPDALNSGMGPVSLSAKLTVINPYLIERPALAIRAKLTLPTGAPNKNLGEGTNILLGINYSFTPGENIDLNLNATYTDAGKFGALGLNPGNPISVGAGGEYGLYTGSSVEISAGFEAVYAISGGGAGQEFNSIFLAPGITAKFGAFTAGICAGKGFNLATEYNGESYFGIPLTGTKGFAYPLFSLQPYAVDSLVAVELGWKFSLFQPAPEEE